MKKQLMRFMHTTISGRFFKAAAVVILLSGAQYVNAQALSVSAPVEATTNAPSAVITHVTTTSESSLYNVKVDNAAGEKFRILVKEADGTILFQNVYSDKNFVKTFSIPRSENDNLFFVIKGLSDNTTQTFEINSRSRYVEDVVIRKVI